MSWLGALLATVLTGVLPDEGGFWMPEKASSVAREVDFTFQFILWISVFFFVLIVAILILFVARYRRREGVDAEVTATHNMPLEITWSVIPLIIVLFIFYFGFKGFLDMSRAPANAYEVLVTAQKWSWQFTYPNGYTDENLHVPVDRPIRLVMQSQDVIHSLYVPAFRIKRDVVPGRYNKAWFEATVPGEYQIFCAEYCGTGHSDMLAKAIVHRPGEFESWLRKASDFLSTMTPEEGGRKLYKIHGCGQCHSTDGSPLTGPTFQGIFGHQVSLAGGGTVKVDENYIRESILNPAAKVVAGFEPVMPTFQGRLEDKEITAVIQYIKSLSEAPEAAGGE